MKITEKLPRCPDKHKDCFAYCRGGCRCLSDTNFGDRACPFFKIRYACNPLMIEAEILAYGYVHGGGH